MNKMQPSENFRQMLCFMFYQDAMDDHETFEERIEDILMNSGYTDVEKKSFEEFIVNAISDRHTDHDIEELFDYCQCSIGATRGGHRYLLHLILEELRRQLR